jgi:hypothetical protein
MSAYGRICELQSRSRMMMTCVAIRSHVLYLFHLLLFEGCCTECCLSDTATDTCRRDSMGWTSRGWLDNILSKSLNIWAISMGHSQLWGVPEWRVKQDAPPYSIAGLSGQLQYFLPVLSAWAGGVENELDTSTSGLHWRFYFFTWLKYECCEKKIQKVY